MYRTLLKLDPTSYIELASRITGDGSKLMFAMRGSKNDKEVSVASVVLNKNEVGDLISALNSWLTQENNQDINV